MFHYSSKVSSHQQHRQGARLPVHVDQQDLVRPVLGDAASDAGGATNTQHRATNNAQNSHSPIADGSRARGTRPPLLDALAVLVAARQAALAANALAGRVRHREAAATDSGGARNNAAVWTCTSLSKLRSAGWRGHTDRSHDIAVAAQRGERRLLHGRARHWFRKNVLHDRPLPRQRVRLRDVVNRGVRVEHVRPRARAPAHIELVAWGGRAMAGRVEVL